MEDAIKALRDMLAGLNNRLNKMEADVLTQKAVLDAARTDRDRVKARITSISNAIAALEAMNVQ